MALMMRLSALVACFACRTAVAVQVAGAGAARRKVASTFTQFLGSDLMWTSCTHGSGTCMIDSGILSSDQINIGGTTYSKGVFAHAPSLVTFDLGGKYHTFEACFGITRTANNPRCGTDMGEVDFTVLADGMQLWYEANKAFGPATCISVDVSGKSELQLRGENGPSGHCDHSMWADAKVDLWSVEAGDSNQSNGDLASLLRVDANLVQKGPNCAQSYIESLTITGKWIKAAYPSGVRRYVMSAKLANPLHPRHKSHLVVGPGIGMVVTHAITDTRIPYLNFRADNLARSGESIGGLLGDSNDYPWDAQPVAACK